MNITTSHTYYKYDNYYYSRVGGSCDHQSRHDETYGQQRLHRHREQQHAPALRPRRGNQLCNSVS